MLIKNFYEWAVDAKWLDRKPYHRLRNGRDVLAWGAVSDLDIRHLTHRQWRFSSRSACGAFSQRTGSTHHSVVRLR
jgi:3-methyladenine DNA glycosylase Tag